MEASKNTSQSLADLIIKQASQYGNSTYTNKEEAHIATKGYAVGYHRGLEEQNTILRELAEIAKLLLPAIHHLPIEDVKKIEEFTSESDLF
jgi:hypothetical protein